MSNRPTVAQQQLFQDMLKEMSDSIVTCSTLIELTPAQKKKILETRKLQNLLIQEKTSEELKTEFSTIKWPLIDSPRNLLYSSGSANVWSQSPFSWFDPIYPNENFTASLVPLDNLEKPSVEPIWLVNHIISSQNNNKKIVNNFIRHLVSQGVTGDTEFHSVAFGGVKRSLKLHDIILAYYPHTIKFDWELVADLTTWKTSSQVEDTIFSAFLNMDNIEPSEIEKVLKRLPALQINWAREFPVNVFRTPKPQLLSLASLVCAACFTIPVRSKNLKNIHHAALNAVSSFGANQQNEMIKHVLNLTKIDRCRGNIYNFKELAKKLMENVSPLAQKTWASTLISESMSKEPDDFSHHRVNSIVHGLSQKKHFDMEHLQLIYKNFDRFMTSDYTSMYQHHTKGEKLFSLWKGLRPYMTDRALDVVDSLSSDLLVMSTQAEIKEWKSSFNLQLNIKPQLLDPALKNAKRKM